jgi:hypothetical protein
VSLINYKDIKNLPKNKKDKISIYEIVFPKSLDTRLKNNLFNAEIRDLGSIRDKYLDDPRFYRLLPNFGKKCSKVLEELILYAYPDLYKISPKVLYTFNSNYINQEEKICTQIVK